MSCLNNHCRHYDTVIDALGGVFDRLGAFRGELGISAQLDPDSASRDPIMVVTLRVGDGAERNEKMVMTPLSQLAAAIASVGNTLANEVAAKTEQAAGMENLKQAFRRHLEESGILSTDSCPESLSEENDDDEDEDSTINYCPRCGSDLEDLLDSDIEYCPYCGYKLPV